MKTLKQQVDQKEKELKILKEKLEFENQKPFKCKELNLEITQLKEWIKFYNEIIIPKGWRLLKTHECIFLIEEGYKNQFIGKFRKIYNYIWVQQTNYSKKYGYSSRVYFSWYGNVYSINGDLRASDDDGRVAFCRELDALNERKKQNENGNKI